MNSPLFFIFNTDGVILFIALVLFYEYVVLKDKEMFMHSLFAVVATFLIVVVLKQMFLTSRPYILNRSLVYGGMAYLSSFPSAHTAISFALATTVSLHHKRLGVMVFTLASLLGISRVVANVHWPIDIVAGVLIGVTIGLFFDSIHFRTQRKRHRKH